MNATTSTPSIFEQPHVVSRAEWLAARQEHLAKEKHFTRLRDQLSRERRALPWVRVEKNYLFESASGKATLGDLFAGRSQLIVYHFMLGPGWDEGCKSCSFAADHFNSIGVHLNARDVSLVAISRAPLAEILPFKARMGWSFNWVSSHGTDFNRDYHVSFTPEEVASGRTYYNYTEDFGYPMEEAHGVSVFARSSAGEVFHTYSSYARGPDLLLGTYNFLDLVPKGRDEDGLEFTMEWLRHHDRYESAR
jgi:predicted dithiol-disulfide oxidoreductase (DUF899 family)